MAISSLRCQPGISEPAHHSPASFPAREGQVKRPGALWPRVRQRTRAFEVGVWELRVWLLAAPGPRRGISTGLVRDSAAPEFNRVGFAIPCACTPRGFEVLSND